MRIQNDKPSTFFSSSRNLVIRDEKGKLFYCHPNKERSITFNLPVGLYSTKNLVVRKKDFIPYPEMPLPAFNVAKIPDYTSIRVGRNKNKATITIGKKKILLDDKVASCDYQPLIVFVIGHELHHYVFEEEELCDIGSANLMLRSGYNPSQINIAKKILFQNNYHRKKSLTDSSKNFNSRR